MRPFVLALAAGLALAACSPSMTPDCHRSPHADGVTADGDLHYPEICSASTTPAVPVALDPVSQALAGLRVDTPDPCRQYARAHCSPDEGCGAIVHQVNQITARWRPYARCVALLTAQARATRAEARPRR